MPPVVERPKADATITMRIPARTRELIDSAAAFEGKSRTEFRNHNGIWPQLHRQAQRDSSDSHSTGNRVR